MIGRLLSLTISIAIVLVFIYAFTKKSKVRLDANGFPINPKTGETFTISGIVYSFINNTWTIVTSNPPTGIGYPNNPSIGQVFIAKDGTSYTFTSSGWVLISSLTSSILPCYPTKPKGGDICDNSGVKWIYTNNGWLPSNPNKGDVGIAVHTNINKNGLKYIYDIYSVKDKFNNTIVSITGWFPFQPANLQKYFYNTKTYQFNGTQWEF